MTVYVDNAAIPATVRNGGVSHSSRWSHLTADTEEELHEFAVRLGLKRSYFQPGKALGGRASVGWHYDVTEGKRWRALRLGAVEIGGQELAEILQARRRVQDCTMGSPCHERACGACYPDLHMEAEPEAAEPSAWQPRRLLITGSRTWTDEATIRRELERRFTPETVLVSGHANGADKICEAVWETLGGRVERHPPNYGRHGRRAPTERDREMVRCGADECVAFIQEGSRGATYTAQMAEASGIETDRHQPSAANYDYQAGLAFQADDLGLARTRLRRAAMLYPHSPERELWTKRLAQVNAQVDQQADQGSLFPREAAS